MFSHFDEYLPRTQICLTVLIMSHNILQHAVKHLTAKLREWPSQWITRALRCFISDSRLLSHHVGGSIICLLSAVSKAIVKPQQNIIYCGHSCYVLYDFLFREAKKIIYCTNAKGKMSLIDNVRVLICHYWIKNNRY